MNGPIVRVFGVTLLLFALLIGMAFHFLSLEDRWAIGIDVSVRTVLRIGPGSSALTRTGKLKRHVIAEQYRALVDAMYGGKTEVGFGAEHDEVKIRDAKVAAPSKTRSAA